VALVVDIDSVRARTRRHGNEGAERTRTASNAAPRRGSAWRLLVETYRQWNVDQVPRLAAALAYYTFLSLAPLLLVLIAVAGLFFGPEAVRGELVGQIGAVTGTEGARAIEDLLASASRPTESLVASIVGVVTLLLGAAGVVGQLEAALNTVWDVAPAQTSVMGMIAKRFASLAMVLAVGFLLLVSLALSAALAAGERYVGGLIPGSEAVGMVLHFVASFAVVTVLFAILFKFLPDARVEWGDVWVGAVATAILFNAGKLLVGLYLGRSGVASAYGAAGSLVVVLVWVYYAAQILLFGAELTQVYAQRRRGVRRRGRRAEDAERALDR
jgi:membrane protein